MSDGRKTLVIEPVGPGCGDGTAIGSCRASGFVGQRIAVPYESRLPDDLPRTAFSLPNALRHSTGKRVVREINDPSVGGPNFRQEPRAVPRVLPRAFPSVRVLDLAHGSASVIPLVRGVGDS